MISVEFSSPNRQEFYGIAEAHWLRGGKPDLQGDPGEPNVSRLA